MSLSCFQHSPHKATLPASHAFVVIFENFPIQFHTGVPDHECHYGLHPTKHTSQDTIYSPMSEELPMNAPPPHGKPVHHTCFLMLTLCMMSSLDIQLPVYSICSTRHKEHGPVLANTKSKRQPIGLNLWPPTRLLNKSSTSVTPSICLVALLGSSMIIRPLLTE